MSKIAFVGFRKVGKHHASELLEKHGHVIHSYGDIVRRQVDPLTSKFLGFKSSKRDPQHADEVRPLLEIWGMTNQALISAEFFKDVPAKCVCPRLIHLSQVAKWKSIGGTVVLITRPSPKSSTEFELIQLSKVLESGLVDLRILNVTQVKFESDILRLI